nr:immunoglobulin light chain junction region [Macaca mulatta]
CMQDVDFPYTF